jgi:hypothetical protein
VIGRWVVSTLHNFHIQVCSLVYLMKLRYCVLGPGIVWDLYKKASLEAVKVICCEQVLSHKNEYHAHRKVAPHDNPCRHFQRAQYDLLQVPILHVRNSINTIHHLLPHNPCCVSRILLSCSLIISSVCPCPFPRLSISIGSSPSSAG